MDKWMNIYRWMDGHRDGWMEGEMDGRGGWIDRCIGERVDSYINIQASKREEI